jgi:hypothetical protein
MDSDHELSRYVGGGPGSDSWKHTQRVYTQIKRQVTQGKIEMPHVEALLPNGMTFGEYAICVLRQKGTTELRQKDNVEKTKK